MYGFSVYLKIGGYINMKKLFAFILTMVLVACLFTGCSEAETAYDSEKDTVVEVAFADLIQVPEYDYLYYSAKDRTVYYLFERHANFEHATGFFGPYIRNGHYCEYHDGKIIEVIPTVKIEDVAE